jgi:hypothetical protein
MAELKVKKHTTYTYETSDGREFDDKKEANEWQKVLCKFEEICMLDFEYKPTRNIECANYVYVKTAEQAEAFNNMQSYIGICSNLQGAGFYRYDEIADEYNEIESEIEKLQHHIDLLKGGEG